MRLPTDLLTSDQVILEYHIPAGPVPTSLAVLKAEHANREGQYLFLRSRVEAALRRCICGVPHELDDPPEFFEFKGIKCAPVRNTELTEAVKLRAVGVDW